jgi:hypothetical protein
MAKLGVTILGNATEASNNKFLDQVSARMEEEYTTLATQLDQGRIKSREFYSRLSTMMRTITTDHPQIADRIRERVKEDFGGLPSQMAFKSTVEQTFKIKEDAENQLYTWGVTNGLEGDDYKSTVNNAQKVQLAMVRKQMAAGKSDTSEYTKSHFEALQVGVTSLASRIDKVMSSPGLDDNAKQLAVNEMWATFSNDANTGMSSSIMTSGLPSDDQKQILELQKTYLETYGKYFSDMTNSKARLLKGMVSQQAVDITPHISMALAMKEAGLGDTAISSTVEAIVNTPTGVGQPSLKNQMAAQLRGGLSPIEKHRDINDVMKGTRSIIDSTAERKPDMVKNAITITKKIAEAPNDELGDGDAVAFNNLLRSLTDASMEGSDNDKSYMIGHLADPKVMNKSRDLAPKTPEEVKGPALHSQAKLSADYLIQNKPALDNMLQGIAFGAPSVQYNPLNGTLEVISDNPISNSFPQVKSMVNKMNQALEVYVNTKTLDGTSKSMTPLQIKQGIVEQMGFEINPNYTGRDPFVNEQSSGEEGAAPAPIEQNAVPEYTWDGANLAPIEQDMPPSKSDVLQSAPGRDKGGDARTPGQQRIAELRAQLAAMEADPEVQDAINFRRPGAGRTTEDSKKNADK